MKVLVDNRETKNRIKKSQKIFNEVEVKRLKEGDYVCKNTAIELKTTDDFIASIMDRRVFNQAIRMNNKFDNTYIIVYGNVYESIKRKQKYTKFFTINSYIGGLASLSQIIRVLKVDNENQAFNLMRKLFEKSGDGKNRNVIKIKGNKNKILGVIMYFAGINSQKAEMIIKENKIENLRGLLNLEKEDLLKVDGIGERTANRFMNYLIE